MEEESPGLASVRKAVTFMNEGAKPRPSQRHGAVGRKRMAGPSHRGGKPDIRMPVTGTRLRSRRLPQD